jgi:tetratricopeptide (TPR) repeat protein
MKIEPSPLACRLDASLREVPVDPAAFAREVDARTDAIATMKSQPARLLAMLVEAAPLLRIAGRLEESRRTASATIAIAELVGDAEGAFAGHLALAQVLQREGRFDLATPLYDRLVVQARSMPAYGDRLHEALFEAGRNLYDQGLCAQAARCFRESQALRRAAGHEHLLEACAEAIRRAAGRAADSA